MARQGKAWHQEILTVIGKADGPMGAYDVLGELREFNAKLAPPTIYRALAALVEEGQIHRLESMNAYVACKHKAHDNAAVMSICDDCGSVEEAVAPDVLSDLSTVVGQSGFAAKRHVIEVHGVCGSCTTESAIITS